MNELGAFRAPEPLHTKGKLSFVHFRPEVTSPSCADPTMNRHR